MPASKKLNFAFSPPQLLLLGFGSSGNQKLFCTQKGFISDLGVLTGTAQTLKVREGGSQYDEGGRLKCFFESLGLTNILLAFISLLNVAILIALLRMLASRS